MGGGRDAGVKYQVGIIWEGIHIAKHIVKQGSKVALQAKEDMDKVKSRALIETTARKAEAQSAIALVKKIYQGQIRPIKNLKNEVEILKRVMIDDPRLEQWSEDIDSSLMPVLELLGERIKHLAINAVTGGRGVGIEMSEIMALDFTWEGQLN